MGAIGRFARHPFRPPAHLDVPEDVVAAAGRLGLRALLMARAATLPTGIYLGLASDDVVWPVALANSLWAIVWVLATNVAVARRGLTLNAGIALAAVDTQIAVTGLVATGGVNSGMCALLGVLPLAAAFALRPVVVMAITAAGCVAMLVAGAGEPEVLVPVVVVLGWAGLAGVVLARDRANALARIEAQVALRGELLRAHDLAAARERLRAADALHEGALVDVRRLRIDAEDGRPAAPLAARCRATAGALRALVSELHAMSARPIVLRSALAQLAARRTAATGRAITVDVAQDAQGDRDDLVLVAVRDILDAVPPEHPATRIEVEVGVRPSGGVEVLMQVSGERHGVDPRLDPEQFTLALLRERLDWVPDAALEVGGPYARVTIPRAAQPARREGVPGVRIASIGLPTVTGLLAVAAMATAAGTRGAAFWTLLAAAALMDGALLTAVARTAVTRGRLLGLAVYDVALILLLLALSGPAQDEILLLVVGLVPVLAFAFPPRTVAVLAAVLGVGAAAIAGGGAPFAVAYLWSTAVALLLADAGRSSAAILNGLLQRRRSALQQLMTAEEDARRAVARSLHDDALQLLFAAALDLDDATGEDTDAVAARERAIMALARAEAVVAGSSLATGGDEVPTGGLCPALRELGARTARSGALAVVVDVPDDVPPGPHEALMYGVARELLTNVVRHAGAGRVTVTLVAGDGLVLRVVDDGCGIGAGRLEAAAAEGHVGLAAARDRLTRAGGRLSVTAPDAAEGTAVTAVLPIGVPETGTPVTAP